MAETETLSPVLTDQIERAPRRLLEKACERDLTLAAAESCTGGGATRVESMRVAVEMMTEML